MKEPPDENLQPTYRQAMNRKWEDVLVFGLADHPAGIRLTRMTTTKTVGWGECNEPQRIRDNDGGVGVRELTPTYELQRIVNNHVESQ